MMNLKEGLRRQASGFRYFQDRCAKHLEKYLKPDA